MIIVIISHIARLNNSYFINIYHKTIHLWSYGVYNLKMHSEICTTYNYMIIKIIMIK